MPDRESLPDAYLAVVDGLPEAALLYDRERLIHVNPEGLRRLREHGIDTGDLSAIRLDELVEPEDQCALAEAMSRTAAGHAVGPLRLAWRGPVGTRLVTSCIFNPITLDGRRYALLLARDVSHRVAAEHALARSQAQFQALFEHSPVGAAVLEGERFTLVNEAMCRILGRDADDLVGRHVDELTVPEDLPVNYAAYEAVARGELVTVSKRYARPDGTTVWGELTALLLRDDEPPLRVLAQLRDVTAEREAAADLRHLALHDPMTGLGNRALLDDRLAHVTAVRAERRGGCAVLFVDLDGFKRINDALGHVVGDRVLRTSAVRVRDAVRPGDTVVRWGGDEFVVLLDGLADSSEALAVVRRIENALAAPIPHRDDELLVTASIGVAYAAPGDEPTPGQLLHDADAALYRAKSAGRARHTVFDEALRQAAARRGHVEALLRQAADGDRVVLHYQPVIDLETRAIVGAEALLRLRDDGGRLLYPDSFLDIAEDAGLMVAVEHVVLKQACRWAARQEGDLTVAVNVCARQLGRMGEFEKQIRTALDRSGLAPERLVCEVTEHAVLEVSDAVVAGMRRLRELGVEFSIDDFGAGHASINYLHRLPVQEIKIDRTYTARAAEDRASAAIIRAVAGLARELGMRCVAEGVEHEASDLLVRALGADRAQGYLYGRPVPEEDFTRLLERAAGS